MFSRFDKNSRIGVFGGGSWATALIKILQEKATSENKINWYMRSIDSIDFIQKNQRNPHYVSSIKIETDRIRFFHDINEVVRRSDILIFVIPSAFLKIALASLTEPLDEKMVVSAIKGIIPNDNLLISEYFIKKYNVSSRSSVVISGPCHAEEIALERLSYLTVACKKTEYAQLIAERLSTRYLHTVISKDIFGIEYAAVLKNIFAIAAGISHGLGNGDNYQSVLASNSMTEIANFLDKAAPFKRNLNASVYLGDLLVTCYSQFSRNRMFGTMLGKGYSVKSAQLEMNMIAEGFYASKCIKEINDKYQVEMPINYAIYNILYENIAPVIEMQLLTKHLQ